MKNLQLENLDVVEVSLAEASLVEDKPGIWVLIASRFQAAFRKRDFYSRHERIAYDVKLHRERNGYF